MPVKFKTIEKGQPGVAGGGQTKFYASPVVNGEANIEQLTDSIEKISTVSGADIRAVLYALVDVMQQRLANGEIVRIGDLGSMRISLSSEGQDDEKDFNASHIKGAKVLFTPGKALKTMLKTLEYKKV